MDLIDRMLSDGTLDSDEDVAFLRTLAAEAAYLVSEEVASVDCDHQHDWPKGKSAAECCKGMPHGKVLSLLMGDTFAYACADGEPVKPEQVAEVAEVYKRLGPIGLICWSAKQRGEDPVVEYTEDPVYQATWRALYGALKVRKNHFNTIDPRWSDEKLNLKPWQPK